MNIKGKKMAVACPDLSAHFVLLKFEVSVRQVNMPQFLAIISLGYRISF